jgi:hypothetical protein
MQQLHLAAGVTLDDFLLLSVTLGKFRCAGTPGEAPDGGSAHPVQDLM